MRKTTEAGGNLFRKVLNFYLFSNVHIALCATALVGVTQHFFGFHLRTELYVFVFCGTFFLYNLQRLPAAFEKADIERTFIRHRWNTDNRKVLLVISILAMLLAAWSYLQLYRRTQLIAVLPALLSVAYAFPVIRWRQQKIKLREIPFIKILIVGLVWGMSCVWVPAAADDSFPRWTSPEVTVWMIACSCMIVSLTIPFDVRDLHYDGARLKTFPAIFGVKKSLAIAVVGMLISVGGLVLMNQLSSLVDLHDVLIYSAWSLITCVVLLLSTPDRHEYYFSLLIDGLMLMLWVMLVIF